MQYQDFLKLTPGRSLVIIERFGQPWSETRIIRRITNSGLYTAPTDSLNTESVMKVDRKSFKTLADYNHFAIVTDLGRAVAKFQLTPEKPKPKG